MPYERKECYRIHEVLDRVPVQVVELSGRKRVKDRSTIFGDDAMDMTSLRYLVFKLKGTTCVTCGLDAMFFAKERTQAGPYHFNLYGLGPDGNEVLFTRDHIIPRKHGGPDRIDNLQTMCAGCNFKKGSTYAPPPHHNA